MPRPEGPDAEGSNNAGRTEPSHTNPVLAALKIRPGEVRIALLAAAHFFLLLCAWYIVRPLRDDYGARDDADVRAALFTGTLLLCAPISALYSLLASRMRPGRFIAITYQVFALSLVGIVIARNTASDEAMLWIGRGFFVWASVFNVLIVSTFWQLMSDAFGYERSTRLFGVVAVGGTLGAMAGSSIAWKAADAFGAERTIFVSVGLLQVMCLLIGWIVRSAPPKDDPTDHDPDELSRTPGGHWWDAFVGTLRSPYLLGVCAYICFLTIAATFLYFQRLEIVSQLGDSEQERTATFAQLDLITNSVTLLVQLFITSRLMRSLGVGLTLGLMPLIYMAGFGLMAAGPGLFGAASTLTILAVVEATSRAGKYAVSRPARETLFTVVPRADRYKAKSVIDTFVYRFGDVVGAWTQSLLAALGLGLTLIAGVGVPIAAVWLGLSTWLGRRQRFLATRATSSDA